MIIKFNTMKYLKLFIVAAAALGIFSACTKEYITKEYITNVNGAQIFVKDYTINPSDWQLIETNVPGSDNYYYCDCNNEDITDEVIALGTVHAYIYTVYDAAKNLGSWNPLPFVYPLEIVTTDDSGNEEVVIVAENTRFDYQKGLITFILQDLDGYSPEQIINSMSIRVCVTK